MKVLITGASGLLGRAFVKAFEGHEVLGLALNRVDPARNIVKCDLRNPEELKSKVLEFRPDIIVHSAAERRPDVCEKDKAATEYLNVAVTEQLVTLAKEISAWVLYISTDYVFDGTKPPYAPNDTVNPLSYYGQTKREGELRLWKHTESAGVLRVPLLYGDVEYLGESAATTLASAVFDKKPITIDDWQVRYPTYVNDVAAAARKLNHITPDPNSPQGAPRPRDCHLDTNALKLMGFLVLTPFEEAIKKSLENCQVYLRPFLGHRHNLEGSLHKQQLIGSSEAKLRWLVVRIPRYAIRSKSYDCHHSAVFGALLLSFQ